MESIAERIYPLMEGRSDVAKVKILLEVMEKDNFQMEMSIRQDERENIQRSLIEVIDNSSGMEEVVDAIKHL